MSSITLLVRQGGRLLSAQVRRLRVNLERLAAQVREAVARTVSQAVAEAAHEALQIVLSEVCDSGSAWGLLHEGRTKDGKSFLTAAGWVRQVARFWHYLRLIGVTPMPDPARLYQPGCDALRPFCGPETAIDNPRKAFAFILGALYGKLLRVQAKRGVNVVSNALTWLKRLTLSGNDLPDLYVKVREKLMLYGAEGNRVVQQLVTELGVLGTKIREFQLDETETCYYLLLGQSLSVKIMPPKPKKTN